MGDGDGLSGMGDLLQEQLRAEPGEPCRWEEVPQAVQQLVHLTSSVWPCTALGCHSLSAHAWFQSEMSAALASAGNCSSEWKVQGAREEAHMARGEQQGLVPKI